MDTMEGFLTHMRDARALYRQQFKELLNRYRVTQLQMDILLFLHNNPGRDTAQSICKLRGLAKSNVSAGVEGLTEKGLLKKSWDGHDRRVAHLSVQPAAAKLIEEGTAAQRRFKEALLRGFTEEELAGLAVLLQKAAGNIKEELHREGN